MRPVKCAGGGNITRTAAATAAMTASQHIEIALTAGREATCPYASWNS